ncbi:MAG: ATP-binding cassette domain-containing protein [Glaciecola sp.]
MISVDIDHQVLRQNSGPLQLTFNATFAHSNNISGIFGDSGAGKTTMLKTMAGLVSNTTFQLSHNEKDFSNTLGHNNPCVYVGSTTGLFLHINVQKNLALIANKGLFAKHGFTLTEVADLCKVSHLLEQMPNTLSSGETQRVQFARALLSGKPVILLDEAFSALDWDNRIYMLNVVKRLSSDTTLQFVMVSHSLKELSYCCDTVYHLRNGSIVQKGSVNKVLDGFIQQLNQRTSAHTSIMPVFSELNAYCVAYDSHHHISEMVLGKDMSDTSNVIFVAGQHPPNRCHTVHVDADKVSLSVNKLDNISMLNQVKGKVHDIHKMAHNYVVSLLVNQQILRVLVSSKSFDKLNIANNATFYAQFKLV